MRNRNINIPLRASEKEARMIEKKAAKAKMNRTDYMIACAVGKRISVVEDLTPMIAELKRIGNNLNQALTLAHMGKIAEVNATESLDCLEKNLDALHKIARTVGEK